MSIPTFLWENTSSRTRMAAPMVAPRAGQAGFLDDEVRGGQGRGTAVDGFPDGGDEPFAQVREAAGDYDQGRVEEVHELGQDGAQVDPGGGYEAYAFLVAAGRASGQGLRVQCIPRGRALPPGRDCGPPGPRPGLARPGPARPPRFPGIRGCRSGTGCRRRLCRCGRCPPPRPWPPGRFRRSSRCRRRCRYPPLPTGSCPCDRPGLRPRPCRVRPEP